MTERICPIPDDVPALRDAVSVAIYDRTLRAVARDVGMSPTGLSKFASGRSAHPYSPTLRRLRRWYQKHASTEDEG